MLLLKMLKSLVERQHPEVMIQQGTSKEVAEEGSPSGKTTAVDFWQKLRVHKVATVKRLGYHQ